MTIFNCINYIMLLHALCHFVLKKIKILLHVTDYSLSLTDYMIKKIHFLKFHFWCVTLRRLLCFNLCGCLCFAILLCFKFCFDSILSIVYVMIWCYKFYFTFQYYLLSFPLPFDNDKGGEDNGVLVSSNLCRNKLFKFVIDQGRVINVKGGTCLRAFQMF